MLLFVVVHGCSRLFTVVPKHVVLLPTVAVASARPPRERACANKGTRETVAKRRCAAMNAVKTVCATS